MGRKPGPGRGSGLKMRGARDEGPKGVGATVQLAGQHRRKQLIHGLLTITPPSRTTVTQHTEHRYPTLPPRGLCL